ncbi:MAG: hypothetical protein A3F68_01265 [Acidobacteria bacterium RIFCSPLOWO2_12_FULL_54_10]|nr:MAG: hypothetical protein A3F68_01265 [Acidobacteria bacterium RIFCSPLOWO2_12_FULL_54_10]
MSFRTPSDLTPFHVLFDESEPNPALPGALVQFSGSFGFPAPPPDRPWVFSNFVQSLDGIVSFGGNRPGGEWIARSRHDRWMMDLLRAHGDAILIGSHSLIQETLYGKFDGGPVFRIVDQELLRLRHEYLGRGKLKNIIVTGSGNLKVSDYRLFRSEHVDSLILTTPVGENNLGNTDGVPIIVSGQESKIDFSHALQMLRTDYGIQYLLCEGGPTLYGHMVREGYMDEKFLTVAPQEIGQMIPPDQQRNENELPFRPTVIAGPGFTIETSRWYRWISCRKAGDHEFNRYRFAKQPTE